MLFISCNQSETIAEETNVSVQSEIQWKVGPHVYDESIAEVYLPSLEDGQEIRAYLWMPSMNHGSSPIKVINLGNGFIRLETIYFIMPGDWELRLEIKSQDGVLQSKKVWQFDL